MKLCPDRENKTRPHMEIQNHYKESFQKHNKTIYQNQKISKNKIRYVESHVSKKLL